MVFKSLLHTPGKCTLKENAIFFFNMSFYYLCRTKCKSLLHTKQNIFFLNIVKYYILYFGVEAYIIIGDRKKFTKNKI